MTRGSAHWRPCPQRLYGCRMVRPPLRIARPRRAGRRLAFELAAALLWPLHLVAMLLAAPFTVVATAEVERWRARECGEDDLEPLHPAGDAWGWTVRRLATRAMVRSDAPIMLMSLALGGLSLLIAVFGFLAGIILTTAPAFRAAGVTVTVGPISADTASVAWLMVPVGALTTGTTVMVLLLVSVARDAAVRHLGGHEAEQLARELGTVRHSRTTMLDAFDSERRRIERDLHDGAQQDLVSLSITLGLLSHTAEGLSGDKAERIRHLAVRAHEQAERSLVRLRETVHGIHPRELTDLGLLAAARGLAERSPIRVEFHGSGSDAAVPASVAAAIYFIVAEALTNVSVHAGVDAARVRITVGGDEVTAVVSDEGVGGARVDTSGTGLAGLRERVRALGGDLMVDSPPKMGTTVTAVVPFEPRWGDDDGREQE